MPQLACFAALMLAVYALLRLRTWLMSGIPEHLRNRPVCLLTEADWEELNHQSRRVKVLSSAARLRQPNREAQAKFAIDNLSSSKRVEYPLSDKRLVSDKRLGRSR